MFNDHLKEDLINILRIGGDPEKVKASQRARFDDETIVDKIIELDGKQRTGKYSILNSQKVGVSIVITTSFTFSQTRS